MSIQGKDVLIIDDDKDIRVLLRKIFESPGMKVYEAENLNNAIAMLEKHKPNIITLDLNLGRDFGIKLLEYVGQHDALKKIPVLIISQNDNKKMIHKTLSLGAADYFVKPINSHMLIKKIRKILRDTEHDSYEFAEGEESVEVIIDSDLEQISEFSFQVVAPVKFVDKKNVKMEGLLLDEISQSGLSLRINSASTAARNSEYKTEISFKGLSKEAIRHIRKIRR